jgi:hypothetical protein
MAIDFPNSPATNDTYSSAGKTWYYTGTTWTLRSVSATPAGITSTELANNAVTTAKIASEAVTAAKIANATITSTQIANATITNTQIASGTITNTQLAANVAATNLGFTPATTGKSIAMAIVFGG